MAGHTHHEQLLRLSAHLEELFSVLSTRRAACPLPPELADEIAATAGEVMIELADHRGDRLVRAAIEDARRLRQVVRTIHPEADRVAEAGRSLVCELELVIREEKRAA
jgi:hypothetical protein